MASTSHLTQLASAKLKPFVWGVEREIRHEDIAVFKSAAAAFEHFILVRATNEFSLKYIGQKGYTPKPIDCKPKTASTNAISMGMQIPCAGLVVDPTLLPNAFSGTKQSDAMTCWNKFTQGRSDREREFRVFRRSENSGFYAVDTFKNSPNYGCLMLSNQNIPDKDFRLSIHSYQEYRRKLNLCYVFGDYDLYGLIDVDKVLEASKQGMIAEKVVMSKKMLGTTSFHSPNFQAIREFLNRGIGTEMIQHGAQDTFGHGGDKLYVFTPLQHAYVIDDSEASIREIYELVLKERPIERSF